MNKKELISIVMNCYNGELYLNNALESIINQTYKEWELIFWDNKSSDNSKKIFDKFKDSRFKYYEAKIFTNLPAARNQAIAKCQGQYIAFLDVDDWWEDNKLEKQILLFSNKEVSLVYGNFMVNNFKDKSAIYGYPPKKIYPKSKNIMYDFSLPRGNIKKKLLEMYSVGIMTLIIRKNVIDEIKYFFNEKLDHLNDFELVLRIAAKYKVDCCDYVVAHKRLHTNNNFNKDKKSIINQNKIILNEFTNYKNLFTYEDLEIFKQKIYFEEMLHNLRTINIINFINRFFKLNKSYKLFFFKVIYIKLFK
tara:strand:- start:83 stop:1000 length:918 start_codon:yes stop_codon:yes gene_type:complete